MADYSQAVKSSNFAMAKTVFFLCLWTVACVLNAADVDEAANVLSAHSTVCIINQSTQDLNKSFAALKGNNTIASLTFSTCLTASDMPAVNAAIATMSALKVLTFIDVDSAILRLLTTDLPKNVNVFVGISSPELFLRRIWKLPGRK